MPALDISAPPIPPSVLVQQAPVASNPVLDFAQQPAGVVAQPAFDPMQYVMGQMNQVADLLTNSAKVLVTEKPALMPLLQKMTQIGMLLVNEIQTSLPQGPIGADPNQAPTQLQMAEPETTSDMVARS